MRFENSDSDNAMITFEPDDQSPIPTLDSRSSLLTNYQKFVNVWRSA
jgi:hypothetical protein